MRWMEKRLFTFCQKRETDSENQNENDRPIVNSKPRIQIHLRKKKKITLSLSLSLCPDAHSLHLIRCHTFEPIHIEPLEPSANKWIMEAFAIPKGTEKGSDRERIENKLYLEMNNIFVLISLMITTTYCVTCN